MHDSEAYRDLGYESFAEYVAQPELGMRRSWAYALIQAANLVQATGLNPREVSGVEVTKLAMVSRKALKALEVGDREAALALVEEARVLGRSDLRARLHEDGERAGGGQRIGSNSEDASGESARQEDSGCEVRWVHVQASGV